MVNQGFSVDFDSWNTNIYMLGNGLVLSEPTVAAVSENDNGSIKYIGEEAKNLIGKTSMGLKIVFPVFEGEIVNEKVSSAVLNGFFKKIKNNNSLRSARFVFSVPCGINSEMLSKYVSVAKTIGCSKPFFVEAPILSILGQGIPLTDSSPCFCIDMAGGTTNIAVVSLDGIIAGFSVNMGGNKLTADIIDFISENYGLQIGLLTAERIKKEIGSLDEDDALSTIVNGRDIQSGTPKSISLKATEIREPVKKYFDKIAEMALLLLKKISPEVSAEIRHAGLYVSGETSMIYGLENYYSNIFNIKINIAENPKYSVAIGGSVALGDNSLLKRIAIKMN